MPNHPGRVIVTHPAGALRLSTQQRAGAQWLYLGKDVQRRQRVQRVLGAKQRVWLGSRLHDIARDVRQPYLDFLASCSREHTDPIGWWSTTLSWRVWAIADLCLHTCYVRLAQGILQEMGTRDTPLVLVIEDPWVLRQLWEDSKDRPGVTFHQRGHLASERCRLVCRGLLSRGRWLLSMIRAARRQRRAWPSNRPQRPHEPAVGLYSYPQPRCIREATAWHDPLLPGLDAFLRERGYAVHRFSPPQATGFEHALAARASYCRPLIVWASAARMMRAFCAWWHPRWPRALTIDGIDVRWLVRREYWKELSQSSLCIYRFYYECLRAMLRQGAWRWLVFPYENQPWEKLTVLAAHAAGVGTVGIQHSTLSPNYLSYFLGAGEHEQMPLPDRVGVAGVYPQELLRHNGYARERLALCGSMRYAHVLDDARRNALIEQLGRAPARRVLVVLSDDVCASRHLLAALKAAFPLGGRVDTLQFSVKTHPATTEITMAQVPFPAEEAAADLYTALRDRGVVLYTGSSVGLEAAMLGRHVVRYRPELLLDMDPADAYDDVLPRCSDHNLREVVLQAVRRQASGQAAPVIDIQQVLAPVQWDVLDGVFGQATPAQPRGQGAPALAGATSC